MVTIKLLDRNIPFYTSFKIGQRGIIVVDYSENVESMAEVLFVQTLLLDVKKTAASTGKTDSL